MTLTQAQLDFFAANGYLPYGRVLDDAELELYRREYDLEFERANAQGKVHNLSTSQIGDQRQTSGPRMLQIMNMCERSIHFRRLCYHPKILDVAEDLIGPNIMLFHDQALFKPAQTGGPVFWHQDNAYWHARPANLVSCWLTLDDAFKENGAMQVIPGSHTKMLPHPKSSDSGVLLDVSGGIDPAKAVVVDVPAGACMFHHCQTLHYTQPNQTAQQRRAFAIHFMAPGTQGVVEGREGQTFRVGFDHPLLRCRT
jgi:phytanoyl-CoA hydroxylase